MWFHWCCNCSMYGTHYNTYFSLHIAIIYVVAWLVFTILRAITSNVKQ